MPEDSIVYQITWQGIPVEITYTPVWMECSGLHENTVLSHIQLRVSKPISITDTGYKSMFFWQKKSDMLADVKQQVINLLDEASTSKKWLQYCKEQRQPSLF